jgi:hypothetical protein
VAFDGPGDVAVAAPLDSLPLFLGEGAIVPMIADDVDTFVPTEVAEYVTLDERRDRLWARILPLGESGIDLFDGSSIHVQDSGSDLSVSTSAGSWFTAWVLDIDWAHRQPAPAAGPVSVSLDGDPLAENPDGTAVDSGSCSGCWHHDGTTGRLLVSIGAAGTVVIR